MTSSGRTIGYGVGLIVLSFILLIVVPDAFSGSDIVYIIFPMLIGIVLIIYGVSKGIYSGAKKISKESKMYNKLEENYIAKYGASGKHQLNQDIMKLIDEGHTRKDAIEQIYSKEPPK